MRHENPDPVGEFIERMGFLAQADGLPRIAGRLYGLLMLEGGPFGLRELAERLQVSRASVSTNARLLARLGAIERVARPGDRQDYYAFPANPGAQLLAGITERLRLAQEVLTTAERSLPADRADAKQRLRGFAEFYGSVTDHMVMLARQVWKTAERPSS